MASRTPILVLCFACIVAVSSSSQANRIAVQSPLNGPIALALDNNGHLYVIEGQEERVQRIDLNDGTISVVVGRGKKPGQSCTYRDGVQATKACLDYPTSLAVDSSGNLFVGEMAGYVRRVDAGTGLISTVAGSENNGKTIEGMSALSVHFESIDSLAVDADGNLFIADGPQVFELDRKSALLARAAGSGKMGFSGDGGLALNASFRIGLTLSLDNADNLLIADHENCRVRRIDHSTGIVRTLAVTGEVLPDGSCAGGNLVAEPTPSDVVADSTGNVYFVEGAMQVVNKIDVQTLKLSTVAGTGARGFKGDGGLAIHAKLNNPAGLAIDRDGNIYIAEYVNNRIRRIDAITGLITTIAGNGLPHRIDIEM